MARFSIFGAAVMMISSVVGAQTVVPLQVTPVSLATTTDATQVGYLLVELPVIEVPQDMRLGESYIEFYMNVSTTREAESPTSDLVTLEIYPYRGTTKGKLDVSSLGTSSMKRTVRVGNSRPVRIYVTDLLAKAIADPAAGRTLIVGAVSGKRSGRFDSQPLPGGSEAKAALTVNFSPIENAAAGQARAN